jgi:DNA replication protein DnaC
MPNKQANFQKLDGKLFDNVTFRRDISPSDMERMCIPRRYWKSSFEKLNDDGGDSSLKNIIAKYIMKMKEMKKVGGGLILFGDNGTGKSCASVVLAKEYRRRGNTVLFLEAADIKRLVFEKKQFDSYETYWDRSKSVDMLIIDDIGKGVIDSTGFGSSLFDEIIRSRNSNKLITILTSNLVPHLWVSNLEFKTSTMKTLKECTIPVCVEGENKRDKSEKMLHDIFYG